jgi:hypothetical protein
MLMSAKFRAVVERDGMHLPSYGFQKLNHRLRDFSGMPVFEFCTTQQSGFALNQCDEYRFKVGADYRIALPIAQARTLFYADWPLLNIDTIGNSGLYFAAAIALAKQPLTVPEMTIQIPTMGLIPSNKSVYPFMTHRT